MNDVVKFMPEMLIGDELDKKLQILPDYDAGIRNASATERLVALQDLYSVFIPNQMSREIYSKLYLSLLRSMQKKQSILAVRQYNENNKLIRQNSYESIIGGSDSFTVIGPSGIGKSSAISRAVNILTETPVLKLDNTNVISCLQVQAPADCSVKGLLLEILRKSDEVLNSSYYNNAFKSHPTVDMLIGIVSQVALNHIGLLIIDEIQNVVNSKNGKTVIGTLTQLINNSGVSICMVGTPESTIFFEQAMMLARRSIGLNYSAMEYGEEFREFCKTLINYVYVKEEVDVNEALFMWFYNHSSGNASIVVSLIHAAQEIAILEGYETLSIKTLNLAFEHRMAMLHDYIEVPKTNTPNIRKKTAELPEIIKEVTLDEFVSIFEISSRAKAQGVDIVCELIKNDISIIEVPV